MLDLMNYHTAIRLENVSFSYVESKPAVNQVSFTVNTGEKIALIGPNGAGKSTLITLLNGVVSGSGLIEIFGIVLEKKSLRWIRSKIGIVFQNPEDQLFCPELFDDIAFGPLNFGVAQNLIAGRVQRALAEVGLSGYENRSSLQLSFGEKKLASIATVLSCEPEIVVLDEPSGNLDPFHRRKIIDWIRRSEKTIFLTSHDLDLVADTCQRVLIMREGRLVSGGTAQDILTDRLLLETNFLELPLTLQKSFLTTENYIERTAAKKLQANR
jgi:cobalt/nickel transport system ATP-binding protein